MRRYSSSLRTSLFFSVSILLYAYLRWWANSGHSPARFPDSISYSHLQFIGQNDRFWSVPFLFSLVPGDPQRVLLQIAIGVFAWSYLAWELSTISRFQKCMIAGVLTVGLTPQVIRFDIAILSESLGISLAIIAFASSLHLAQHPTAFIRTIWWTSIVLVGFTRPTHLILLLTGFGTCWITYLFSRRQHRHMKMAAVLFTILSLWGIMQLRGNQAESTLNFYSVLQRRICTDLRSYSWFTQHGMPDIPHLCDARGYAYSYDLKNTVGEILQLPENQQPLKTMVVGDIALADWAVNHAWSTYSQYLISHPGTVSKLLTKHATSTLDASEDSYLPTTTRNVIPAILLRPWWLWSAVGVIASSAVFARTRRRKLVQVLFITSLLTCIIYIASVITSAVELERHAATSAVMLRVCVLATIAIATCRVSEGRVGSEIEPVELRSRDS